MKLFSLGDPESIEIRNAIEESVNDAIFDSIRKNLYCSNVSVKIEITLDSVSDEDGNTRLQPVYQYKTGYKIGASYQGNKGKTKGNVGLRISNGILNTVRMNEQTSMLEEKE